MKMNWQKVIFTFGFSIMLLVTSTWGRIPFNEAAGMYANTKDEHKPYSPFWGMVAVHGHLLEMIRFFGNYKDSKSVNKFGAHYDVGEDSIARFIKTLFNSPDGIQFVASTYQNTPTGNLAKNLGAINDIIEILLEKELVTSRIDTDFFQRRDQLLAEEKIQKDALKQLVVPKQMRVEKTSPDILSSLSEEEQKEKQRQYEAEKEEKKKKYEDAYKKYIQEKKTYTEKIREITAQLKSLKKENISQPITLEGPPRSKVDRIIDVLNKIIFPDLDESTKEFLLKENVEFTKLLVHAFERENIYANPESDKYIYPQNIVIIALLAFFADCANERSDVSKLSFLMKQNQDVQEVFDHNKYKELKNSSRVMEGDKAFLMNPEAAFLLGKGFEMYETSFVRSIEFREDTSYRGQSFPDCAETLLRNFFGLLFSGYNQGKINFAALDSLEKKLKDDNVGVVLSEKSPFTKMLGFFKSNPSMAEASKNGLYDEWAEIVSDLNQGGFAQRINDVQYGRSLDGIVETYEIVGGYGRTADAKGIINTMNVFARLIPDAILNKEWSSNRADRLQEVALKLDRLCHLLSREGLALTWENQVTKKHEVEDESCFILFKSNNMPIFYWDISEKHFNFYSLRDSQGDWRLQYKNLDDPLFPNEWIASLYLEVDELSILKKGYGQNFPLALIYSPQLRTSQGMMTVLTFVLYNDQKMQQFFPLIPRWIHKSIPMNDNSIVYNLSFMLYTLKNQPIVSNLLSQKRYPEIDKWIDILSEQAASDPNRHIQNAADKGQNILLVMLSKERTDGIKLDLSGARGGERKIVNEALSQAQNIIDLNLKNNSYITDEGIRPLTALVTLNLENNSLITDVGIKSLLSLRSLTLNKNERITDEGLVHLSHLKELNLSYNRHISNDSLKRMTELTSLNLSHNPLIIDEGIIGMTRLLKLDLSGNDRITDAVVSTFINLEDLDLRENSLITNEAVKGLTKLKSLGLNGNQRITSAALHDIANLTRLDLGNNHKITNDTLKKFVNLEYLGLEENGAISSTTLASLKNLKELNLASNGLIDDRGLQNLTNLQVLDLTRNGNITDNGLSKLINLEKLYLKGNWNIKLGALLKLSNNKLRYVYGDLSDADHVRWKKYCEENNIPLQVILSD